MGWGTTFRDLTMPIFEVPKIVFWGGGPLIFGDIFLTVPAVRFFLTVLSH